MRSFIRNALIFGTSFGILMGAFFGIVAGLVLDMSQGIIVGVVGALTTGIPFGLIMSGVMSGVMSGFMTSQRRDSKECPEITGEDLLHDGPANHFLNREAVGGWLYLTDQRLFFRSHKLNLQPHELSMPLTEISEVRAVRTAKIFPNGLRLVTISGAVERFVVEENKKWCAEIVRAQARKA